MWQRIALTFLAVTLFGCNQSATVTKEQTNIISERQAGELQDTKGTVLVLDKQFTFPSLPRDRKIRLYLPPGYENSDKHYPVLYMHDAQNLFDEATSYAGEWMVDESLDVLAKQGLEIIVVGIDNGGETRMMEYSAWPNTKFGEAEGAYYMEFMIDVVKPYIDDNYRTLTDRNNTAVMGSSMGGLISHYALIEHSDVFSKAGVFSPSYWYSEDVFTFTQQKRIANDARIYWIVGDEEGNDMVNGLNAMVKQVSSTDHPPENRVSKVVAGQGHNEGFWASEFSEAVHWLFKQN